MQFTGIYPRVEWVNNTNVYEVNVRQYTEEGTFNAFANSLQRLKDMGVETLWFMPVTPIAQLHKKGSMGSPYACSDYTSINPEFGSMDDFKTLVNKAHDLGMKVIIDWVANHTGWDHVWTVSNPDFYKHDDNTGTFKVASGMDDIIELNYENAAMRKAMINAMLFWVNECGIDGFRCDLASWVNVGFWHEARAVIEQTKNLFWLAEMDPIENPDYMHVFDAAYSWKWMHATEDYYKKNLPLATLNDLLPQYDSVPGVNAIKLWFTSNHDENSWNGTEYEKYGEMALSLAIHSFTWNGIPLIYSGQELPNNKRLPFFEKGIIEWSGNYEMADFYKTLLALRKNNPALRAADESVMTYMVATTNFNKNLLAYLRKKDEHEVLVLLNLSKEPLDIIVTTEEVSGRFTNVFNENESVDLDENRSLQLRPWQYMLYEKK